MAKYTNKKVTAGKTDYNLPTFGYQSAMVLLLSGGISTWFMPYVLSFTGIDRRLLVIVCNALILGFATAFVRFFIESKRGFCRKFWVAYGIFGAAFAIISYFWMYLGTYI